MPAADQRQVVLGVEIAGVGDGAEVAEFGFDAGHVEHVVEAAVPGPGQAVAQMQSTSNLTVMVAFTSGSSSGTVTGTGSLAYLGTMANGTFSFMTGATGCTSGTFTMSQG